MICIIQQDLIDYKNNLKIEIMYFKLLWLYKVIVVLEKNI